MTIKQAITEGLCTVDEVVACYCMFGSFEESVQVLDVTDVEDQEYDPSVFDMHRQYTEQYCAPAMFMPSEEDYDYADAWFEEAE